MANCKGPGPVGPNGKKTRCDRKARAEELCSSHYRQALRARERGEPVVLTPLRQIGEALPQSFGVRVSDACRAALEKAAAKRPKGTAAAIAREILEAWAAAHP